MNNYDDLFKGSTNIDETIEKKIEDLNEIFNGVEKKSNSRNNSDFYNNDFSHNNGSSYYNSTDNFQKNESPIDPLEKTSEISNVDLETLRNYSKMLHDAIDEPKEEVQSSSQANSNGKVLVRTSNNSPFRSSLPENKDMSEILQAFISCSILSFVTAGMGVGWLLYIIMHI